MCLPPGPGIGHQILRSMHHILKPFCRVGLVDYPGHRSSDASTPVSYESCISAVVKLTDGDTVLLGHSWGSGIALKVAERVRCRAVILISPYWDWSRSVRGTIDDRWHSESMTALRSLRRRSTGATFDTFIRAYAIPKGFSAETRDKVVQRLICGVPFYEQPWRRLRSTHCPPISFNQLAGFRVRTLIVIGSFDPLVPPVRESPGTGAAADSHISIVTLSGSHYPFLDDPEGFRCAVTRFLLGVR